MPIKQTWKNIFWLLLGVLLAWLILPFFQRLPGINPVAEPLKVNPAAAFNNQ